MGLPARPAAFRGQRPGNQDRAFRRASRDARRTAARAERLSSRTGAGGVLRIAVPDAERFIQAYCTGGSSPYGELGLGELPSDLPTKIDVLNHVFHQGHEHRWGYDYVALADRLARAGFTTVERSAFRRSRLPELGAADLSTHERYSLYVEAVR